MEPVRLGLISTAGINGAILAARGDDAPFEVAAVGSRDASRARAYASEHGVPRSHGSYDGLLADPELDAVYVALPNALHHEWTMRALAAGKHVLCEKPYTRRPHEVDKAWDEAERRGLVLTEAYMWRHAAQTKLLLDLLPRLGELQSLHAVFTGRLEHADDPRWRHELGGGALLDLGCYCVSAARLLAGGEPDALYAEPTMRGEVDVRCSGLLRFGEVTATFDCSLDSPLVNTIDAVGSDGVLHVPQAFVSPPGVVVVNGDEHRVVPAGDHYRAELDDFCAAIRGEREVLIGRADMLGQAGALAALSA